MVTNCAAILFHIFREPQGTQASQTAETGETIPYEAFYCNRIFCANYYQGIHGYLWPKLIASSTMEPLKVSKRRNLQGKRSGNSPKIRSVEFAASFMVHWHIVQALK